MSIYTLEAMHGLTAEHVDEVLGERVGVRLTKATAAAFIRMREAAALDGLDLHVASGFRDFARQNLIYSGKYNGTRTVLDAKENPIDISPMNDEEKLRIILYFSAVPGLSRHHYGTDIDVFAANLLAPGEELDLTNRLYGSGAQLPLTRWLDKHMADFGFFRPYKTDGLTAGELWHISYGVEADKFTSMLKIDEAVAFCRQQKLCGICALERILTTEFRERFQKFSV